MASLSQHELDSMGFASLGENLMISDRASFYNCSQISIGNNVRIDDYCVLSAGAGGIKIGNYVHIAVYASLIGAGKIIISDFCGISSHVSVYSSSDDYSGAAMTNPMVPAAFTNVTSSDVILERHVIVGSGSVILPGVVIAEGAAIGALSLVREDCRAFGIYVGAPVRFIKERKRDLLHLASLLMSPRGHEQNSQRV